MCVNTGDNDNSTKIPTGNITSQTNYPKMYIYTYIFYTYLSVYFDNVL